MDHKHKTSSSEITYRLPVLRIGKTFACDATDPNLIPGRGINPELAVGGSPSRGCSASFASSLFSMSPSFNSPSSTIKAKCPAKENGKFKKKENHKTPITSGNPSPV